MREARVLAGLALLLVLAWSGRVGSASAQTVTRVAAGRAHTLFLESDGTLWGMGDNEYGQLGLGYAPVSTNVAQQITSGAIARLAVRENHSLFTIGSGLWAMGENAYGELGDGTYVNHVFPENVVSLLGGSTFTGLGAGYYQSLYAATQGVLFVTADLYGMGDNANGQLGTGTFTTTNRAELIKAARVTAIAGGEYHTLFVQSDGSLWAMGANNYGQLGDGTTSPTNRPKQIVASGVTAVACGAAYSLFLKSDGSLWGMGQNYNGQLGDNTTTDRHTPEQLAFNNVTAIAAGYGHTLFIKSDGSLWAMGYNNHGQLGDGTTTDQHLPVRIVAGNVIAVAAGSDHSLFIKSDGSLWGMGDNQLGQLGVGTYSDITNGPVRLVPPAPPALTSIQASGSNVVVTWPYNDLPFHLESTTNLFPATWNPVSPEPSVVNGHFAVTNALDAQQRFYRLSN